MTDCVNGVVIGGEYFSGALFFNGRKQGKTLYAKSTTELVGLAGQLKEKMRSDTGPVFDDIYRGGQWELRIFN